MKIIRNSKANSFKEQNSRAKEILDSVVRPQVKIYEMSKVSRTAKPVRLTHAQKAHLSCKSPI